MTGSFASGIAVVVGAMMVVGSAPTRLDAQDKGAAKTGAQETAMPTDFVTVPQSPGYAAAVAEGTRSTTGEQGPLYWQQWATYDIRATLEPGTQYLNGSATVWYFNRSPNDLDELNLHLRPNLFSAKVASNTDVPITGGVTLAAVTLDGEEVTHAVLGTILQLAPAEPVASGDSVRIDLEWSYRVPPNGAPRGGYDGEVFFVSYWYPQMAVYDDVSGWNTDQYLGNAEFYMGYADYRVELTLPEGWLVGATGTLANPEEVLSRAALDRLERARSSRETVNIVGPGEREAGRSTTRGDGGTLTWRFEANNVRDVTWTTSDRYVWDATFATVGDRDGDGVTDTTAIYSFYRPRAANWLESARYAQASIEVLSAYLWPYPYPHMTAGEGPASCGGMEYPMMTCIGSGGFGSPESLYNVIEHEIGHMWFPMQVGSNEKRHAWMDEGLTQFNEIPGMADMFPGSNVRADNRDYYLMAINAGIEEPLMVHGDEYGSEFAYGIASYFKPATALVALQAVLGEDRFLAAFREYGRRWVGAHPTPWDFWNTFNDVAGENLDWFWRSWFFETWTLDQGIGTVTRTGDNLEVEIQNLGTMPFPVFLRVTETDGGTRDITVPVDVWLEGAVTRVVTIDGAERIARVIIDADRLLPDTDRRNQSWSARDSSR